MKLKVNLNDNVKIKITKEGEKSWDKYWQPMKEIYEREIPKIQKDKNGYTEMQLWSVMEMFGPDMHIGFNPPIETDIILLGD